MTSKRYKGIPYHVWNQGTDMNDFMVYFGFGPEIIVGEEGLNISSPRVIRKPAYWLN